MRAHRFSHVDWSTLNDWSSTSVSFTSKHSTRIVELFTAMRHCRADPVDHTVATTRCVAVSCWNSTTNSTCQPSEWPFSVVALYRASALNCGRSFEPGGPVCEPTVTSPVNVIGEVPGIDE